MTQKVSSKPSLRTSSAPDTTALPVDSAPYPPRLELEVTCWTNPNPQLANDPAPFDDKSSMIMGVRHKLRISSIPPREHPF
ncbi:hypothetical protein PtA15_4A57 [Puccinia triticina]|uniref:Uncharacterized protein n=1 Tax=Puccinia triticina TaxID=208348 RepID=A0ABY7CEI2_9BASI|nr:uncharacterized protein PtA15_4A57 [Puccinia triticina]WAQ83609.1 hypothetical protein PtA15_4A57 [Puccinia triticina]